MGHIVYLPQSVRLSFLLLICPPAWPLYMHLSLSPRKLYNKPSQGNSFSYPSFKNTWSWLSGLVSLGGDGAAYCSH